jgi:inorganic pyrophosphatase
VDRSLDAVDWLGRTVEVVIDRPLGSNHPRHADLRYELNYGFVPGTVAPDGEPLDAYLLDVSAPVEAASGMVIAIVRRRDDVEDKLVVLTRARAWGAAAIAAAVRFQEQYFDSYVEMAP